MSPRRGPGRAPRFAAVAGAIALLVALATGAHAYLALEPLGPDATAGPGRTVTVAGVDYRLDRFAVGTRFAPDEAGDDPVRAPTGTEIVLVTFTRTVHDRRSPLDEQFCDVSLRAGDDVWQTDDTVTYGIARPRRLTCSATDDAPLAYDEPARIGVAFLVPAGKADRAVLRIEVDGGDHVVELHR